jgi:parallel beta-helix repeat protein
MTVIEKARVGMIAVAAVMLVSVARRLMGARRLSSGMMALVVAGMVVLVAAGGASANGACIGATTVFGPGDTVTESCTFNASMTCSAGHGLIIGADGITIDGAGYAITGDRTACPNCGEANPQAGYTGILNYNASLGRGHDDVVIKDLEIKNFCSGIVIKGAGQDDFYPSVDNNTIFECSVHDNGDDAVGKVTHGIHLWRATNTTVKDCAVYNNTGYYTGSCGTGGHGIRLYGNSDKCTVEGCNIYNNTHSGIFAKYMCDHCTIAYNKVTDNGAATDFCGGIRLMCMKSNYNIMESI